MINHSNPLIRMAANAFTGAVFGFIGGLILGFIIQYTSLFLIPAGFEDGPWQVATFLGMGFGSVIGATLGGFVGMRK